MSEEKNNNENNINQENANNKEKIEKSLAREIMEWIICIVVAFTLALLIKYFLFTPTLVKQKSMQSTILNGERVLINRLVRTFNWDLERGDIITFEAPSDPYKLANGGTKAEYKDIEGLVNSFFYNVMEVDKISYIKRVIGIAGDVIEIKNGDVYVNNEKLEESYLDEGIKTVLPDKGVPTKFTVPEGYIFAMGDNREESMDCRAFGCVPVEKVEGRVSIRIWPLNKFGAIDKEED